MKKVLVIAALLIGAVSFTKAQGGGGGQGGGRQQGTPEERAQRTLDGQQLASLNLTADQKGKLLPHLVKMNKSTDSLMATIPADGDRMAAMQAMAPKRAAITDVYEKMLIAWLTAEQKKAYDTALAAVKERRPTATGLLGGGGFGGRGGQGGGGNRQGGQGGGTPPANNN